uniref:Uncharacterized protein n=1 Tax=Macaca nemestrina TaxID=9545 RepID=A0A2K6D1G9_MACNE
MTSLEISSSASTRRRNCCYSPLVEDSAFEPSRKDMDEGEEKSKEVINVTTEKLPVDEVPQLVISPLCGAVSLFVGTTRNNFEGKKLISLEYEAYLPMAENEVKKICSDIRQKWPVKHIAVFHGLAASLGAVSYATDTLKEIYEESSSWKGNIECFGAFNNESLSF